MTIALRVYRLSGTHADRCRPEASVSGTLTRSAKTVEDRMVTGNRELGLLFRDVPRHQRHRHVDIDDDAAIGAVDVVVALDALVEPARLVGERQLLDQSMLGQQVERAVHGAVGNRWVLPPDTLENFARGQVTVVRRDFGLDDGALGCVPVAGAFLGNHGCCPSRMPISPTGFLAADLEKSVVENKSRSQHRQVYQFARVWVDAWTDREPPGSPGDASRPSVCSISD